MNGVDARERILDWSLVAVAAVYFGLSIFNAVTRTGKFSPDSFNYVNVAKNILSGKGVTQPTLGFNQENFSLDAKPPVPFVDQAPLYPVMIAAVSWLGLPAARAALLLSAVFQALVFVMTFGLATALYDKRVGLVAAALMLFDHLMRPIQSWALTEPIALVLLLVSLWLLTATRASEGSQKSTPTNRHFIFIAGLCAGAAFATRYALIVFMVVGVAFLVLSAPGWRAKALDATLFALGFGIPATAVFLHNVITTGALMPVHRARTDFSDFRRNLYDTLSAIFDRYWHGPPSRSHIVLSLLSILAVGLVLTTRRDFITACRDIFISNRRYLLVLWSAVYPAFLIIQRRFSYFDIDARILLPAGIVLVVLWSAAILRAVRFSIVHTQLIAVVLLLIAVWQQARATITTPPLDFAKVVQSSERLSWIAEHTTERDLIIGSDVVDIPFLFNRPFTFSFSPFPYSDSPTYDNVMSYARRHCDSYENVYIVIRVPRHPASESDWRHLFGLFVADLVAGREDRYDGVERVANLSDALIFQIACR